jgi:hypothetical protein
MRPGGNPRPQPGGRGNYAPVSACFPSFFWKETELTATTVTPETDNHDASPDRLERLYTIRAAAELMGIKYWLLLSAVNQGTIPPIAWGNTRRRVRCSDMEAALQASRT